MLVLITGPVYADCMRDSLGRTVCGPGQCATHYRGEIYCARNKFGTATLDRHGNVVCGIGQCEKDFCGDLHCSKESGGGVVRNDQGEVDCFGKCEPASVQFCEQSIVGQ